MRIERITLRNYKVFRDVEIRDVPPLAVFVGANGTGKSTLFDVFGFLKDCLAFNLRRALASRGGYGEVLSRGVEGSASRIEIEIKFRMEIAGRDRLVTYVLSVGNGASGPFVAREILRYKRAEYGAPFHLLDFRRGRGTAITNEEDFDKPDEELDREEQRLESDDILAIKGLGQFERFKAASAFRRIVEQWHVSDFHIDAARGTKDAAGYAEHLSSTGDNLARVAPHIHETRPEVFREITEAMIRRVPGIREIEPRLTEDGGLLLRFRDGTFHDPFVDRYVSDGTIKMFAYLVLLHDPGAHPLLCVEEPEYQLYPQLLAELAEEFRTYAGRGGQVFVSTHSPDFLDAARIEEVFWLEKRDGTTRGQRARDHAQLRMLVDEGDRLGLLWRQGFFEGADP